MAKEYPQLAIVIGDAGAAAYVNSLLPLFSKAGQPYDLMTDQDGAAKEKVQAPFILNPERQQDLKVLRNTIRLSDAILVNLCSKAYALELEAVKIATELNKWLILTSDGIYNQGLPQWRDLHKVFNKGRTHFFAIDTGHANMVRDLWASNVPCIHVVGQPAFQDALDLRPQAAKVRRNLRRRLFPLDQTKPKGQKIQLKNHTSVLCWFESMRQMVPENLQFVRATIAALKFFKNPVLVPAYHPGLNKPSSMGPGYIEKIDEGIRRVAAANGVLILDRPLGIPEERLNLAVDLVLAPMSTAITKQVLMGLPRPVTGHFAGPDIRRCFEEDFGLKGPDYLVDVIAKRSLPLIRDVNVEVLRKYIKAALDSGMQYELLQSYNPPPTGRIDECVAKSIMAITYCGMVESYSPAQSATS